MKRRVVITGLGVVTSLSCEVEDLWQKLLDGESGIHPLKIIDVSDFKVRFGGDIHDWDPSEHIPLREQKRIDRFSEFAIVAGVKAV
ncbi:MAG: beta-ketoacyl-[acyl-carrier-protein] synthase II, partial [bacterium]|nr:beta-ketoacyl-[acyl-carrier-protein] synthase II [bacterium]